jgi:hypothetical protein
VDEHSTTSANSPSNQHWPVVAPPGATTFIRLNLSFIPVLSRLSIAALSGTESYPQAPLAKVVPGLLRAILGAAQAPAGYLGATRTLKTAWGTASAVPNGRFSLPLPPVSGRPGQMTRTPTMTPTMTPTIGAIRRPGADQERGHD